LSQVIAPVTGIIVKTNIKEGDEVSEGQIVVMLQCMKTEIPVTASESGIVSTIRVQEGDEIEEGEVILEIA
jgi:biotin carboxyl carrier protein